MRQRQPRLHDPKYLAWLRDQPCCCGCGRPAPSEAAHILYTALEYGKPHTGKAEKSHDSWAVPLAAWCHRLAPDSQHNIGEAKFWGQRGLDPCAIAIRMYYGEFGGDGGKPRPPRKVRPRKPEYLRQKIPSRPFGR